MRLYKQFFLLASLVFMAFASYASSASSLSLTFFDLTEEDELYFSVENLTNDSFAFFLNGDEYDLASLSGLYFDCEGYEYIAFSLDGTEEDFLSCPGVLVVEGDDE